MKRVSMKHKTSFQVSLLSKDTAWDGEPEDVCWAHHMPNGGYITVVSRMTGFGYRDVETGYRSPCGKFWLASGKCDIRDALQSLFSDVEMAGWVIDRANNCFGAPPYGGYPHLRLETMKARGLA